MKIEELKNDNINDLVIHMEEAFLNGEIHPLPNSLSETYDLTKDIEKMKQEN